MSIRPDKLIVLETVLKLAACIRLETITLTREASADSTNKRAQDSASLCIASRAEHTNIHVERAYPWFRTNIWIGVVPRCEV